MARNDRRHRTPPPTPSSRSAVGTDDHHRPGIVRVLAGRRQRACRDTARGIRSTHSTVAGQACPPTTIAVPDAVPSRRCARSRCATRKHCARVAAPGLRGSFPAALMSAVCDALSRRRVKTLPAPTRGCVIRPPVAAAAAVDRRVPIAERVGTRGPAGGHRGRSLRIDGSPRVCRRSSSFSARRRAARPDSAR